MTNSLDGEGAMPSLLHGMTQEQWEGLATSRQPVLKHYTVALRRPGGSTAIATTASSMRAAIKQVCAFEGAPHSAVISVWYRGLVAKGLNNG